MYLVTITFDFHAVFEWNFRSSFRNLKSQFSFLNRSSAFKINCSQSNMNICWPLPIDPSEVAGRRDDLASTALQALRYEGGGTAVLLSQFLDDVLYVISIPLAEVVAGVCEVRVLPVIGVWTLSLPAAQVRGQGRSQQVRRGHDRSERGHSRSEQGRGVTAGQRKVTAGQREATAGQREVTAGQREVTAGQRGHSRAEGGQRSEGGHSRSEGGHSRSQQVRGRSQQVRGRSQQVRGRSQQVRGRSQQVRGRSKVTGKSQQVRGRSQQVRGVTAGQREVKGQRGHSRSEGSQPADRSFTNFQVHRCAVGRANLPARSSIPGVCSLLDICSYVN